MKYVPERFRESTEQWYGKNGYSWHIIAFIRKYEDDNEKKQDIQVHVAVLEDQVKQNSCEVFALMKTSIELYLKANEGVGIKQIYIKSDNAG